MRNNESNLSLRIRANTDTSVAYMFKAFLLQTAPPVVNFFKIAGNILRFCLKHQDSTI